MNLVCFPNYCAGGLVCDLLNNKKNKIVDGTIAASQEHNFFKVGNNGILVQRTFDRKEWDRLFSYYSAKEWTKSIWYGTHIHPSVIPNLSEFKRVICITDETRLSKLYRIIRLYNIELIKEPDINKRIGSLIGNMKLLKDTFTSHKDCTNIEFCDIVDGKFVRDNDLDVSYFEEWKQANAWLYDLKDDLVIEHFNQMYKET